MPNTPANALPSEVGPPSPPMSQRETLRLDDGSAPTMDGTHPTIAPGAGHVPVPADPEGKPFGRYRLLGELGRGGMGVVWKAWDTELKRVVALKQILGEAGSDPSRVERFTREARLAAKLRHPGIVAVFDIGVHEGQHFYTSELVAGAPLDRRAKGGVAPRQAVAWAREVANALACAHAEGVLHRDVKPSNILIDEAGHAHVADFGLAREADFATHAALTASGEVVGTPAYMSPEQARAIPEEIGPASDQFSVGVVLYEMLAGRLPFEGASLRDLFNAIVERDPVPPTVRNPRVHRDAETICLRALEKDPARRYASMADLAADLGRWLDGEPIQARPLSLPARLLRRIAKSRAVAIPTAIAVLFAIGVVASLATTRARDARRVRDGLDEAAQAEATAEIAASRDARQKAYLSAREALSAVLRLDPGNSEAARALARVGARLAAIDREEAADRDAITRKAASAEEALRKATLVSRVLGRWTQLAPALERMERWGTASALPMRERRARAEKEWPAFEQFMRETPDDPTSQSTMRAFAGWARLQAGRPDEALDWLERAAQLDSDVPYASLLQALDLFAQYVEGQTLPMVVIDAHGISVGAATGETAPARTLRASIEALLARAEEAPVWGQEGAGEHLSALAGIRAMQTGDYASADAALSRGVAAIELRAARSCLLLARAKVRYLRKDFKDALEDVASVIERRPDFGRGYLYRGLVEEAIALEEEAARRDPRAGFEKAIASLTQAIEKDANPADACLARGNARSHLAGILAFHGEDPRPLLRDSIADYTEAGRLSPGSATVFLDRGNAFCSLAEALSIRGEDPAAPLAKAIADCDTAVAIDPDQAIAYGNRGLARIRLGDSLQGRGEEALPVFDQAVADLDAAIKIDPAMSTSWYYRGMAQRGRGMALAAKGSDPTGAYDRALSDLREAAARGDDNAPHGAAMTWMGKADWETTHDVDATSSLEHAVEEFGKTIVANPRSYSLMGRGLARVHLAKAISKAGRDPRPILQDAIDDLTQSIAGTPDAIDAWINRALAFERLADAAEAAGQDPCPTLEKGIADMDEAVRRAPTSASTLCNRADMKITLGQARAGRGLDTSTAVEGAMADLNEAIRIAPRFWRAYGNLGRLYELIGDPASAASVYEKAIPLSGQYADDLRGRLERARKAAEQAERDKPAWVGHAEEGYDRIAKGDYEGARPILEEAIKAAGVDPAEGSPLRPRLANAWYNLACVDAVGSTGRSSPKAQPKEVAADEAARLRDEAFSALAAMARLGWENVQHLEEDSDLVPLHDDPRWKETLQRVRDGLKRR